MFDNYMRDRLMPIAYMQEGDNINLAIRDPFFGSNLSLFNNDNDNNDFYLTIMKEEFSESEIDEIKNAEIFFNYRIINDLYFLFFVFNNNFPMICHHLDFPEGYENIDDNNFKFIVTCIETKETNKGKCKIKLRREISLNKKQIKLFSIIKNLMYMHTVGIGLEKYSLIGVQTILSIPFLIESLNDDPEQFEHKADHNCNITYKTNWDLLGRTDDLTEEQVLAKAQQHVDFLDVRLLNYLCEELNDSFDFSNL